MNYALFALNIFQANLSSQLTSTQMTLEWQLEVKVKSKDCFSVYLLKNTSL